ncbi:DnaA regulatory inactivator Hda [Elongatibacter sediminis]|uniref:DnaA regulatory inactivator Hda n=1 Tax=Elongatibacter sediminis TaxID=3119006 RepID=A0AAW9RKY7_9GAMM
MATSPQILLPLEGRRADTFAEFVPGPNGPLIAALTDAGEPAGCILIRGSEGSGKSHLLNALCNRVQDEGRAAFYMALARLPESAAEGLAGLEGFDLVCVDDIDSIAGSARWEEALFHCFNRLREHGCRLVLSTTLPLASIPFGLPDLRSRVAWGLRLRLQPLDDDDKSEVLRRRAASLGIALPDDVRRYLLRRSSRNVADLVGRLEAVRTAALAGKRRITVPLARQVLDADGV